LDYRISWKRTYQSGSQQSIEYRNTYHIDLQRGRERAHPTTNSLSVFFSVCLYFLSSVCIFFHSVCIFFRLSVFFGFDSIFFRSVSIFFHLYVFFGSGSIFFRLSVFSSVLSDYVCILPQKFCICRPYHRNVE
jgi:hypothetical protein